VSAPSASAVASRCFSRSQDGSALEERALTEELIRYDTSTVEGIKLCAGFVKGWLEARDIVARQIGVRDLPVTLAEVGPQDGALTVLLHGHLDVVPGRPAQFVPQLDGDRMIGRGTYDMKGALACLLLALADLRDEPRVRVRLGIVPDEESEEEVDRGGDRLVESGFTGDFAITGEPTDLNVGVAAKGVLAMRIQVAGRAAHGATPWLGENAILRAYQVFRELESLPFAGESSELFDRPSINLGRILGGDALNKVPDACVIDVDVRYLPEQDPDAILAQVRELPGARVLSTFSRPPVVVDPESEFVQALRAAAAPHSDETVKGVVGRDGASDAVCFIRAGVPAVEFGPVGGGHHGPEEWVSLSSLRGYRQSIVDFITGLPEAVGVARGDSTEDGG
jgi:succinyl-diaminopimelate desuccinylase